MWKFRPKAFVNNQLYDDLGARWYIGQDHPVALLRAEAQLKNPWVSEKLSTLLGRGPHRVLDVGCGGGLLSNQLAGAGHVVTGLDLSWESLEVAHRFDQTRSVSYLLGDATDLPFGPACFDAVCAMDVLEHVYDPGRVIEGAARVLRKGGAFFFHTFNRGFLSWLFAVKGMEWFVKGTPKNLHVFDLFIRPIELEQMCRQSGLQIGLILGMRPVFSSALLRLLWSGRVPERFRFAFTRYPWVGYCGYALRVAPN